ncbi:MAG: AI-2E family transporter, partial [Candidatus Promineifilaceae bacterium]
MDSETQQDSLRERQQFPSSPSWSHNTKLFVSGWVAVFAVAVTLFFNQIVILIVLALIISLLVRPLVDFVNRRTPRIPRWLVTAFFYLILLGGLLAAPISAIPSLWGQVVAFITSLPDLLQQLVDQFSVAFSEPIYIFGEAYYFPVNEIALATYQDYFDSVISLAATSVSSVSSFAGDVATGAIVFFSRVIFVLFVSFYLTKDEGILGNMLLRATPTGYRDDIIYLMERIGLIWGAFLRGQFFLMLIMGIVTFVAATILGLPNPVALAVI